MSKEEEKLPEGWVKTTLYDVTVSRKEKVDPLSIKPVPYISLKHIESVTNRIISHGMSTDVKSLKSVFCSGDVLYGKLRPYLNKVSQPEFKGVCSTDILVFAPSQALDNRFLLRLLSRIETVEYANRNSKGINLPRISPHKLDEMQIKLPPFKEQKRIVAKIEDLQGRSRRAREALETIPNLLEQLRQSILAAAFRGDLTRKWREQNPDVEPASELLKRIRIERRKRWEKAELDKLKAKGFTGDKLDTQFAKQRKKYKEPEPVDTTDLSDLPVGWCWASLDLLTEFITSGSRGWANYYSDSGSAFIRAQDIKTEEIILKEVAHVKLPKKAEGQRTLLRANDLLITITGANVTKAALVREELADAYVSQHVALARPVDDSLSSLMHLWSMSAAGGRGILLDAAYGGGKPGLNLSNLRQLPIPIAPREEIAEFINFVQHALPKIGHIKDQLGRAYKELDSLEQSILSKAFRGELVPQDPNDEPASGLLGRIRKKKVLKAEKQKGRQMPKSNKMKHVE